jgi:hypothetical protein
VLQPLDAHARARSHSPRNRPRQEAQQAPKKAVPALHSSARFAQIGQKPNDPALSEICAKNARRLVALDRTEHFEQSGRGGLTLFGGPHPHTLAADIRRCGGAAFVQRYEAALNGGLV